MKKYSIIFFIRQSLNGLFMNSIMSITSIFILTACLVLTGCFALLSLNTNLNLQKIDSLNKIVFYIDDNYESEEDIARIKETISNLDNVERITFVEKEDGLREFMQQEEFAGIVEDNEFFENFIKAATVHHKIEIEYKNISDVGTLDYQLRCIEGMYKIKNRVDIAEVINNLKSVVMLILAGFSMVLFIIAVFIILNTVKLSVHSRKNEIEIMRYIGATNFFIIFPFLLEGVIIGLLSGIVAYFAQSYIYSAAISAVDKMEAGLTFISFSDIRGILFFGFVLTGMICGLFGSGISSRRYLKV